MCWVKPQRVLCRAAVAPSVRHRIIAGMLITAGMFVSAWRMMLSGRGVQPVGLAVDCTLGLLVGAAAVSVSVMISLYWYERLRRTVRRGYVLEPDFFRLALAQLTYYPVYSVILLIVMFQPSLPAAIVCTALLLRMSYLDAHSLRLCSGIAVMDGVLLFWQTMLTAGAVAGVVLIARAFFGG